VPTAISSLEIQHNMLMLRTSCSIGDILMKISQRRPNPASSAASMYPCPISARIRQSRCIFPEGTILGGCAGRLAADTAGQSLVYGKADPGRSAELRFLATGPQTLVIQLRDSRPDKAKAASWSAPIIWRSGPAPSPATATFPIPPR